MTMPYDRRQEEIELLRTAVQFQPTLYMLIKQLATQKDMERCLKDDPGEGGWMAFFDASACPEDLILLARAIRPDGTPDRTETGEITDLTETGRKKRTTT